RGDGLAHAVEGDVLVRHVLVERGDLRGREGGCDGGGTARGGGTLEVLRDDAAVRAGAFQIRKIDTRFGGETAGERCHRAAADLCGAIVLRGRPDFEIGIEI